VIVALCRRCRDDRGQSIGPELMIVLVFALAAWGVLAWLGRLNSTAQDIENTAQSAARAASQQPSPGAARAAANRAVAASSLSTPCMSAPTVAMRWQPGPTGTWRGGSVTVVLTCRIENREPFTGGAGETISASDTQVIDRFQEAAP
jgi:Flp pilus assembly protein TadG